MLALLLVAVSVGLDNSGASTALGVSRVDRKLRLRVAVIFGTFEAAMPIVGLLIGHSLVGNLGSAAKPLGGTLLSLVGLYAIASEFVGKKETAATTELDLRRLIVIVIGAALSIDNLVIGFALGNYHVSLVIAAVTIGVVSVALSLLGLELGGRLSEHLGKRSELFGGAVLIPVGVAIGTGLI